MIVCQCLCDLYSIVTAYIIMIVGIIVASIAEATMDAGRRSCIVEKVG